MTEHLDVATTDIDLPATPETVWEALTTDDGLSGWLGDGARIEPTEGGGLTAPDPVTGRPKHGRVERIEPSRQLVFTWWPDDDEQDRSAVTIALEPIGDGCRVTVTERRPLVSTAVSLQARAAWAWRCSTLALVVSGATVLV